MAFSSWCCDGCGEIDLRSEFVWIASSYVMHFFVRPLAPTVLPSWSRSCCWRSVHRGHKYASSPTVFGASRITTSAQGLLILGSALPVS